MANEQRTDLISRQALIAEYDRVHIGPPGGARKLKEDAPTVDAVEVVHGRWVVLAEFVDGYTCASCSVCGEYTYKKGQKGPFMVEYAKYNYCPNCGAKMDGGNEDG